MREIVFGSPEHIAGLSRKALEEDFRWMYSRMMEMEDICERLDAENAELRETLKRRNRQFETMTDMWAARGAENARLRELAVGMYGMLEMFDKMFGNHDACETPRPLIFGEDKSFKDVMRDLGVEVDG